MDLPGSDAGRFIAAVVPAAVLWLRRLLTSLLLVGLVSALGGCVVVQPWQRGRLAQRHMQVNPTEGEAYLDQHIASSKESAVGGTALQGGGCGCN